jgi:primosomal protein N' (replication factor Y) (superfamily II helicase)
MSRFARVALDVPLDNVFDYEAEGLPLAVGSLVVVPFGRRRSVGVVVGLADQSELPRSRIKRIERQLEVAPLDGETLAFARFCADYYRHPLGQTLATVLPTQLRKPGHGQRVRVWRFALTASGRQQLAAQLSPRAAGAHRLLAALTRQESVDSVQARLIYPRSAQLLQRWVEHGWVRRDAAVAVPPSAAATVVTPDGSAVGRPALTAEQRDAVDKILGQRDRFRPWLLQGVTGSGKTEVYLELIEAVAADGGQTLLLVPEINLTPQLEARFAARLPRLEIVSLHSGLAEVERLSRWERARAGQARVILGTRLAVFTPLPRLALIVVDEEHDTSFKQQDGLRYHARDMAIYLASSRSLPVVLGSATPSLETYANALSGRFGCIRLQVRPAAVAPPQIRLLPIQGAVLDHGLSQPLIAAIESRLARQEQSLIYINRRGYAPVLHCHACGWMAECRRCVARLTLHLKRQRLQCHYCGHEERITAACPSCGNQDLRGLGQGTQRIEETVAAHFPRARVLRVDSDSTRRKGSFAAMRERIHAREVDVLVGTQMLAKGHDFPRLTLVGVVGADHGLYSSEFRAAERLFQQLMQVAGRAGRADLPGEVLVQTEFPDHPLYRALVAQDFERYGSDLLAERRRAGFPPYVFQVLLRAEGHVEADVDAFLEQAAAAAELHAQGVEVYDPVPAAIPRIAGRFRAQLLVQSDTRPALKRFVGNWHPLLTQQKAQKVRWALDIDPIDL